MEPSDHFLRDTIATTLLEQAGDIITPEWADQWADAILTAIATRADEQWVMIRQEGVQLEAATPTGARAAQIIGCMHYWEFCNTTMAGDPQGWQTNPDDVSYLHVCELDEMISSLVALRELHRRHRSGEILVRCDHSVRDGAGRCQACGNQATVIDTLMPPAIEQRDVSCFQAGTAQETPGQ